MTSSCDGPIPVSPHDERISRFRAAGLYLVTSAECSAGRPTGWIVERAIDAGVRLFQLREKSLSGLELFRLAEDVRRVTDHAGALLIINDRLDVALAVGADGVHLGQQDFPIDAARKLAPDLILGASSHSLEEALSAQDAGASYVNIGPVFPTTTKPWGSRFLGAEAVRSIGPHLRIPFTVMGGIQTSHIRELADAGARIFAVVTAVTAQPDPAAAARGLLDEIHRRTPAASGH